MSRLKGRRCQQPVLVLKIRASLKLNKQTTGSTNRIHEGVPDDVFQAVTRRGVADREGDEGVLHVICARRLMFTREDSHEHIRRTVRSPVSWLELRFKLVKRNSVWTK